jgi:GNAT superfamily N-acetyltransferase
LPISACVVERISADHALDAFDCGKPVLNEWLKRWALTNDQNDSSRVFLLVENGDVVGYTALTMGSVIKDDAPASLVARLPGYPVGAVVLARFAIDQRRQGEGYGLYLFGRSVMFAVQAGSVAAARLLIVDALDEDAAGFYRQFGFKELPEHPLRLYARLKDLAATIEAVS